MKKILLLLSATILISACARQGYPSGGPTDVAPPVAVGCKPANESRHFNARKFYVEFDEYVVLKSAEQNVLVSPPLKNKPEYSVKGKGVQVTLNDILQENTTYLFQFKEAIADYTEGNVLPTYEYVFSTGDDMDTMMIAGRVLDARTDKPWSEILTVAAYRNVEDTVPALVTRTDKNGNFAFHYIPQGSFHIVAFEDKNRDLQVDSTEAAAWDDLTYNAADSIDSTAMAHLRVSAPDRSRQRLLKAEFTARGRISIITLKPMQHPQLTGEPLEWRLNTKGDSMSVWCLNESCDSTVLILTDEGLADTLKLRYRAPVRKGRRTTQQQQEPLIKALCSGSNAYYDDLRLGFSMPVKATGNPMQAEVMALKDSSVSFCPILLDSNGLQARLNTKLHSGENYRIRLADSLFTDLYGHPSDSLLFNLTPKDYGILTLHIDNKTGYPLVIEVLDSRDTVVQYRPIRTSGSLKFLHLPAAEYRLRAVVDCDGNGRWTTGDWLSRRQPEECILYEKKLQLREKWELEERWTVTTDK